MILSVVDKLNEWVEPIKSWIQLHYNNPLLWIGLFLVGLVVFLMTYSALNRDK